MLHKSKQLPYRFLPAVITIVYGTQSLACEKPTTCRSLDAIVLLDRGVCESAYRPQSGAVTKPFADAIASKAAPIIVSGVILHNFFNKQRFPDIDLTPEQARTDDEKTPWLHNELAEGSSPENIELKAKELTKTVADLQAQLATYPERKEALEKNFQESKSKIEALQSHLSALQKTSQAQFDEDAHKIEELFAQFQGSAKAIPAEGYAATAEITDLHNKALLNLMELNIQQETLKNQLLLEEMEHMTALFYLESEEHACLVALGSIQASLGAITQIMRRNRKPRILTYLHAKCASLAERISARHIEPACPPTDENSESMFVHWMMYKHSRADLYLLVPRDYQFEQEKCWKLWLQSSEIDEEKLLSDFRIMAGDPAITSPELIIGFPINHPAILQPIISRQELMHHLDTAWSGHVQKFMKSHELTCDLMFLFEGRVDLDALKQMFTMSLLNRQPSLSQTHRHALGLFCIYMNGHGWYARQSRMLAHQLDPYNNCAGLTAQQWQDFLHFASETAWYLHYVTCYGGGHTLASTRALLNRDNSQLLVSCGALTDATTMPSLYNLDYQTFFARLRDYFVQTRASTTGATPDVSGINHHIIDALNAVTEQYATIHEQDMYRPQFETIPVLSYPGSETCSPVPLINTVSIINPADAAATAPLSITNKKAVVFVNRDIQAPLVIETDPTIRLPILISAAPGQSKHVVDSLALPVIDPEVVCYSDGPDYVSFSRFLKESIFHIMQAYQKLYRINHLTCANDTGIEFCGNRFQHVERIYIHKWTKHNLLDQHPTSINGSVILVIKQHDGLPPRYFQGIWHPTRMTIISWQELMPEIADREIARLEAIAQ